MPTILAQILPASVLNDLLEEGRPVEDIVMLLFTKGADLAQKIEPVRYRDWDHFLEVHAGDKSELVQLEGPSVFGDRRIVILTGCPMAEEMSKLNTDGTPPAHFVEIVKTYKEQNPGSNAILHPGCIVHQVARQLIVGNMEIEGEGHCNYYQLACRSLATGKIVYDANGLEHLGMTETQAEQLIGDKACLYVIITDRDNKHGKE